MAKRDDRQFREASERFHEWIERGPGEAILGGIIKAAASNEKRRLQRRLEIKNLFPEIEQDDRTSLARTEQHWQEGDRRVRRCRSRKQAIGGLLKADAGLQITEDDLRPDPHPGDDND